MTAPPSGCEAHRPRQIELTEDVRAERGVELLVGNILHPLRQTLLGRIVHQNVDAAQ